MLSKNRLSAFYLNAIAVALCLLPLPVSAQSTYGQIHNSYYNGYDDGYDDGYEDGYDDCMDDCPCPPTRIFQSGFYVGVQGGYESFQTQRRVMFFDEQIGNLNTNSSGTVGSIFAGYGKYFRDQYYLGGEVFLGTSGARGSDQITSPEYNGHFSASKSYGFNIRPGFKPMNLPLFYLNLGYGRTQFIADDAVNGNSSSATKLTNGFAYGVGAELPLYKDFGLRLDYKHINYSTMNNNNTIGSRNSPSDNQALIGGTYHFRF